MEDSTSNLQKEAIQLLKDWYVRIRVAQKGHYQDASQLKRSNRYIGITVVALSTIVGTGVFASIEQNLSIYFQIATGLFSLLAAVLASLQTFLNYSDKSEKHLEAARKLSELKKEIEQALVIEKENQNKTVEFVIYIRSKWSKITNDAPIISESNFKKFFNAYNAHKHFPNIKAK